ncbi:MAG: hypothetical protein ACKVP0_06155 [Pirellulaceae bacterium]
MIGQLFVTPCDEFTMHIYPNQHEIDIAADLLVNKFSVSAQLLGQLFDTDQRDQANSILQSLGNARLTNLDLARLLIQREGPGLFSGSHEDTRELRLHLLKRLPDEDIEKLAQKHPVGGKIRASAS